jgi:hydrogenase maturation protease
VTSARVIGVGNPEAGDDAAGRIVARGLRALVPHDVEVVEVDAAISVLDHLEGADTVIVIDAVCDPSRRRPPGASVRMEAGPDGLAVDLRSSLSSHGIGVAEALGLAAALGPVPRVVVHGIEMAQATVGAGLSPQVAKAISTVRDAVLVELGIGPGH